MTLSIKGLKAMNSIVSETILVTAIIFRMVMRPFGGKPLRGAIKNQFNLFNLIPEGNISHPRDNS